MNSDRSTNVLDDIQTLCKDYRRCLKRGDERRIEDYLERVDESSQEMLFQNLLHIEIEFRRRRQREEPSSHEYLARFPQFAKLVRQTFFESTLMSMDGEAETPPQDETIVLSAPAARRLGGYELVRELGRGGFGVVYAAKHLQRGEVVALKTLPMGLSGGAHGTDDAERLHKFRQEFRQLSEVNHPNLVGMYTLEVEGNQWFLTMDLVDGVDFLEYVRPKNQLDEERLRSALKQLVAGIVALHERGIVHRDLKPSNVLVETDGRVTILDFGLVAELQQPTDHTVSLQSQHFVGTPRYAAPEQAAGTRSAAADWYALGVMIYEALTGEPPFNGSAVQLLVQKQTTNPPRLSGRNGLSTDLAALADDLLNRTPEERPNQTEIASRVSVSEDSLSSTDSKIFRFPLAAPFTAPSLVGRESQMDQLAAACQQWNTGDRPVVVFVSGKSGEGKTLLIEHFLAPLRQDGRTLVLTGKCYDRESVPYKAIDGLVDALVGYLRSLSDAMVAQLLPNDTEMLTQLFPVTRRVAGIARLDVTKLNRLDAKQVRQRAFNALKELLANISRDKPLALFVDDLQWGDEDSAAVLLQLLSPPNPPSVLLLGSFRSDEASNSEFLTTWDSLREQRDSGGRTTITAFHDIAVFPLSEQECIRLVLDRVGRDTPAIRGQAIKIHRSTGGNPHLVDQLVESLDIESETLPAVSLNEVIDRRLCRLPEDAKPLLEVISVSGHAIPPADAAKAAGLPGAALATLNRMRNEGLIRLIGSTNESQVDTYHDKIRETVLERIEDGRRRTLHLAIGETIEELDQLPVESILASMEAVSPADRKRFETPARIYDLAYHFLAADDPSKALAYSLLGAEQARRQFALKISLTLYRQVKQLAARRSSTLQYRVTAGLGNTELLAGEYAAANTTFDAAIALADSELKAVESKARQAEISYKAGSLSESIATLETLVTQLGIPVRCSKTGLLWDILHSAVVGTARSVLPHRSPKDPANDAQINLAIQLLQQLSLPSSFRTPLKTLWAISKVNTLARGALDPTTLCSINADRGWVLGQLLCSRRLGRSLLDEAVRIAQGLDNLSLQARALFLRAATSSLLGCPNDGLGDIDASRLLYQRIGDSYYLNFTQYIRSLIYSRLGRISDCVLDACQAFQVAIQVGQHRLAQTALGPWAFATDGNFPFAELRPLFQPVPDDRWGTVSLRVAESTWHRFHGRTEESVLAADRAMQLLQELWPVPHCPWPATGGTPCVALPNFAHALRAHSEAIQDVHPAESRRYAVKALRIARQAVRIQSFVRLDLPYSLRELSLAYAGLGKCRRGYKYAAKSLRIAEQQGAKQQYLKSFVVCGRLGEKLGRTNARQQIEEGQALLDELNQHIETANANAIKQLRLDTRSA